MADPEVPNLDVAAATAYEELFVPALFAAWAERVADAAHLREGERVLDVACGTGVLARAAAKRVAPGGSVTGLDSSDGMLAVAARRAPGSPGERASPSRCRSPTRAWRRSSRSSV